MIAVTLLKISRTSALPAGLTLYKWILLLSAAGRGLERTLSTLAQLLTQLIKQNVHQLLKDTISKQKSLWWLLFCVAIWSEKRMWKSENKIYVAVYLVAIQSLRINGISSSCFAFHMDCFPCSPILIRDTYRRQTIKHNPIHSYTPNMLVNSTLGKRISSTEFKCDKEIYYLSKLMIGNWHLEFDWV